MAREGTTYSQLNTRNDVFETIPARSAVAVTPDDTTNLAVAARALYIGVAGDVSVEMVEDGSAIVFKAVPVGILPIMVTRVNSTGTAATNIVALF